MFSKTPQAFAPALQLEQSLATATLSSRFQPQSAPFNHAHRRKIFPWLICLSQSMDRSASSKKIFYDLEESECC